MEFIIPTWLEDKIKEGEYNTRYPYGEVSDIPLHTDTPSMLFLDSLYRSCETYNILLKKHNWKPQEARNVLPNSLKTELVMTANIREWRKILYLRGSNDAHPQMRALMNSLREFLISSGAMLFFKDVEVNKPS
jgi:thymidylate synthase ThyX